MFSGKTISIAIHIHAPVDVVWGALTNPVQMKAWMAEPEMALDIFTDWKVGSQILIKGFHHVKFENKGTVLQFEPYSLLRYNYLSSLSRLPDRLENYVEIQFSLTPMENQSTLTISICNFATETIYHHTAFYWKGTSEILKKFAERQ